MREQTCFGAQPVWRRYARKNKVHHYSTTIRAAFQGETLFSCNSLPVLMSLSPIVLLSPRNPPNMTRTSLKRKRALDKTKTRTNWITGFKVMGWTLNYNLFSRCVVPSRSLSQMQIWILDTCILQGLRLHAPVCTYFHQIRVWTWSTGQRAVTSL